MSVPEFDALRRRSLDAATRLRRAARGLHEFAGRSEPARTLVGCLDPSYEGDLERLERSAADLRQSLRRRRLAAKLGATAGRTPEEAAAFAAKALEMADARV